MLDDPLGIIVQGIFVLAAGMYPVGFLFGTCSACCCRIDTCEGFDLEEAFSHRTGGGEFCPSFTQGPSLLSLSFSPTCFGSGVAGTVQGLGADKGPGPLQSVKLTSGGSGYAKLGRQAPTLTLGNENTSPATVSFTLAQSQDGCELPLWSVSSISVTDGGEGYTDNEAIVVTAANGDTVVSAASGTIHTKPGQHQQPTIEASTQSGTGATLTVNISQTEADPATWTISSIPVSGESEGYVDGEQVILSPGAAVVVRAAAAVVVTQRVAPELTLGVVSTEGGSGAQISAVLVSNGEDPEVWSVDSLSIDDAGTGYGVNEEIVVVATNGGIEETAFLGYVIGVGDNGEITQAYVFTPGGYYVDTNELKSIRVDDGGEYYDYIDNGEIESITVSSGGVYYGEDSALEPYVRTPTVTVQQTMPSAGEGAVITAVVDDNTSSPTFGEVVELTLDDAGDGYLAWEYISDFEYLGGGRFAIGPPNHWQDTFKKPVRLGCRAVGDGFAGKVTKVEWEFPYEYEWDDKTGCCTFDLSVKNTANSFSVGGTTWANGEIRTVQITDVWRWNGFLLLGSVTGSFDPNSTPYGDTVSEFRCDYRYDSIVVGNTYAGRYLVLSKSNKSWTSCLDCNGNDAGRAFSYTNRPQGATSAGHGRWVVTVSPEPPGEPEGCVTFCGQSGMCVGQPEWPTGFEFAGGPYGSYGSSYNGDVGRLRRMCVRWLCRCYEGTGKKGDQLFPNPEDWYTVKSTSAQIGGAPLFGGSLASRLEAATEVGQQLWTHNKLEHEYLFGRGFGYNEWPAYEGDVFCVVYAFTFYGSIGDPPPISCENPVRNQPRVLTPRDAYQIIPCKRC